MSQRRLRAHSGWRILTGLLICRNPGVDFGEEGWDLDELPHPLCSGKRKQVQHGQFGLRGKYQGCEIPMTEVADVE